MHSLQFGINFFDEDSESVLSDSCHCASNAETALDVNGFLFDVHLEFY